MDTNEDLDFVDGNEPSDNEAISSLFVTKMSQMDASR